MTSRAEHDDGLTLAEVLRHCAALADELERGVFSRAGERHRLSYMVVTLSEARAHVEAMLQVARSELEILPSVNEGDS